MDSIWRPVVKTGYFQEWKDKPSNVSALSLAGIEISICDGKSDRDCEYPDCKGFFGSAFGSVRTRNRLVWLHVWHYTLRYKADFFQIHFCWWRRNYSLSLTLFSEMYELRGCKFLKVNRDRWNGSVAFKVEPVMIKAWFCMKNVSLKKLIVTSRASHRGDDGILCGPTDINSE